MAGLLQTCFRKELGSGGAKTGHARVAFIRPFEAYTAHFFSDVHYISGL